jgi:hypothetical protein
VSRTWLRVIIYGYGALLVLGVMVFPRQWWAIAITWLVLACGLISWNTVRLRRRARQLTGMSAPTKQANAAFLQRTAPSLIVAGVGILLLGVTVMTLAKGGRTTPLLVWGSLLLFVGVVTVAWAAFLRFRRPPGRQ